MLTWIVGAASLGLAVASISFAAWRLASLAVPGGTLRALATATLAASIAVVQALALGLFGLGTSRVGLPVAAALTGAIAWATLPAPATTATQEAARWWAGLSRPARAVVGGTAAAGAAWLGWVWWRPVVGYDGMLQNLLEVGRWLHDGRPGSRHRVFDLAPVEAFPLTNDVVLSWLAGMGRSFAVVAPWAITMAALLLAAVAWSARALGACRQAAWLAAGAVVTVPHVVAELTSPKTDVSALAWLACCGALLLGARDHPRLLPIALLAGGLSIGSKTTTVPIVAVVVAAAVWAGRREVARRPAALVAGLAGAVAVGGVWYLRNLVDHGSPLWPFASTPWGDPVAPVYQAGGSTFLEAPFETLRTQLADWLGVTGGGLLLVAVGLPLALVAGRTGVRLLAGLGLVAVAAWMVSPVSGLDNEPLAADVLTSTTRYLVPAMTVTAIALAVVAARPRWRAPGTGILAAVLAANVVACAGEGTPVMPPAALIAVATAGGALVASGMPPHPPSRWVRALGASAGAALLASLAVAAYGWTGRHRDALRFGGAPIEALLADPAFVEGDEPVLVTNIAWSDLAGDALDHDVRLLPRDVGCDALDRARRQAWLVLIDAQFGGPADLPRERGCLADVDPTYLDEAIAVYAPDTS
ncbi:MAG: hypothetical protein ACRD0V_22680 [Acidimicrobiales bacterium]